MITNYDHITDAQIAAAVPFSGYSHSYLDWPLINGKYNNIVNDNAYHIKMLANFFAAEGIIWSHPLYLFKCGKHVYEGNHRLRAIKYLYGNYDRVKDEDVVILEKECWRCKNKC